MPGTTQRNALMAACVDAGSVEEQLEIISGQAWHGTALRPLYESNNKRPLALLIASTRRGTTAFRADAISSSLTADYRTSCC